MLAKEIQHTKKIMKVSQNEFNKKRAESICQIMDYGIIVLNNFDGQCKESVLVGYYFMPEYGQNLYKFLV